MRLAIPIPFTHENKKKRYPVRTRYHKTTASGWGHVETFAHNRKETHLEKLEKLEHKINARMEQLSRPESRKKAKVEAKVVDDGLKRDQHGRFVKDTKEPVPA